MRRVNAGRRVGPEIATAKVCHIVAKARALESEDEGVGADASNAADDGGLSMLTYAAYGVLKRELVEFINDLDQDEAAALVALAWIGRGDYEPGEWRRAVKQAGERREAPTARYLIGMPLLPDYLEDALDAFGRSCEDGEGA